MLSVGIAKFPQVLQGQDCQALCLLFSFSSSLCPPLIESDTFVLTRKLVDVGGNVFSHRFAALRWRSCLQNFRLALGQHQQARDLGKAMGRIGLYQFQEFKATGPYQLHSWRLVSWHPDRLSQADTAARERVSLVSDN